MGLDDSIVDINRISEAGPPGGFWPVVFVAGCNLRCPYCINATIAAPPSGTKYLPLDEVIKTLDSWGEEGVMISGGEPLANPDIVEIVAKLGEKRKVGVSTNGSYPLVLDKLLVPGGVSYVAMDFKFSPVCENVSGKIRIIGGDQKSFCQNQIGCAMRIGAWLARNPDMGAEFRMTLYPNLVDENDVKYVASEAHIDHARLVLQQYRQNKMFDDKHNEVKPYTEEEVSRLKAVAEEASLGKVEVTVRWP